tara:strand:+ start:1291 stop:1416 length:126 start_codon:yes stop_codon:yes gene_type:complete
MAFLPLRDLGYSADIRTISGDLNKGNTASVLLIETAKAPKL